uniref:Ubiquitin-like domain-containing protein n=1 Tax=Prymnesium polylepis TaxID=72548 RepID=A0A7S4IAT7_9EUKA
MLRDEGLLRDLSAPGLLCPSCEIQKLSADFPAPSQLPKDGLTEAERRFCCQCLKEKAGAIAKADPSNPATRILEQLKGAERASKFKVLSEVNVNQSQGELNQVKVVRVTGAFSMVPAAPGMSVAEFKKRVQAAMAVAPGRQRLVFKGKTLVDGKSLGHHGVHGDATITLIEQMYTTQGTAVSNLSFDLTWGFPARGSDFLDGSCLLYAGTEFVTVVDYSKRAHAGVWHSGDQQNDAAMRGTHNMKVDTTNLPANVDKLFFALSAYNCRDISLFRTPKVDLKDGESGASLSDYQIESAGRSEAVIMCAVIKIGDAWRVDALGVASSGTVRDYSAMQTTCVGLMPTLI